MTNLNNSVQKILTGTQTAGTANIIDSQDVEGARWMSIQTYGTWTATVNVQFSNNNTNFVSAQVINMTANSAAASNSITSNSIFVTPVMGRFVKIVTGAFTSGTVQVAATLYDLPSAMHTMGVGAAQTGAWNVGGTIKDDGRAARNLLSYGTQFGGTAAGYATLVGSAAVGVGTSIWVQNIELSNTRSNSLDIAVGFGTELAGTAVLCREALGTSVGAKLNKNYTFAVNNGMTNQDLTVYIGAAGTIDANVSYFISA